MSSGFNWMALQDRRGWKEAGAMTLVILWRGDLWLKLGTRDSYVKIGRNYFVYE
jgi:hypothetical protein